MKKTSIEIFISGDFCPINRIGKLNKLENTNVFSELKPVLENADIKVTNLECPLIEEGNAIKKTGPALKAGDASINLLTDAGFNLVTLANNHIMDYGRAGLKNTLEILESKGIAYVGGGLTSDVVQRHYCYEHKGIKLAIMNFCENEWSTNFEGYGANPIDPVINYNEIKLVRSLVDQLIIITHGGHELYDLPSPKMVDLFRFYIDAGADMVVNHHTHYYSGFEEYKGKMIFYSLGNFLFDNPTYRNSKWNTGLALKLKVAKEKIDFEIISFEQCNDHATIKLHNAADTKDTLTKINRLNQIIGDREQLSHEFNLLIKKSKKQYLAYVEPHSNKYIFALQNRNIFPRLSTKRKKLLLTNLLRCESHREALTETLKNEISDT